MDADIAASLTGADLRAGLVALTLEWERRYGIAPSVTTAVSEYDAALLVGHTPETVPLGFAGQSAVSRGWDFQHGDLRYQVKANRPSGRKRSRVTLVAKASNFEWDRLVWLLYDREFRLLEAWEWEAGAYRAAFESMSRVRPPDMRRGRQLLGATAGGVPTVPSAGSFAEPSAAADTAARMALLDLKTIQRPRDRT